MPRNIYNSLEEELASSPWQWELASGMLGTSQEGTKEGFPYTAWAGIVSYIHSTCRTLRGQLKRVSLDTYWCQVMMSLKL